MDFLAAPLGPGTSAAAASLVQDTPLGPGTPRIEERRPPPRGGSDTTLLVGDAAAGRPFPALQISLAPGDVLITAGVVRLGRRWVYRYRY